MTELVVSPLPDGRTWVLVEAYWYRDIQVPRQFMTDFASVPRPFWWLWPQWGKYGIPAVVHDYGYKAQIQSRPATDRMFRTHMEEVGVNWSTRSLLYAAVRVFGWLAWRRHVGKALPIARSIPVGQPVRIVRG